MAPRVYYIEDAKEHFREVQKNLTLFNIEVYPPLNKWIEEQTIFSLYLQNPNEKHSEDIERMLERYEIDAFIIDIKIDFDIMGGPNIYKNIFSKNVKYKDKAFIFISIEDSEEPGMPYGNNIEFVSKGMTGKEVDFEAVSNEIHKKLKKLLNLHPSIWKRVSTFFKGMEDAI